jgi:hypothetical protein
VRESPRRGYSHTTGCYATPAAKTHSRSNHHSAPSVWCAAW